MALGQGVPANVHGDCARGWIRWVGGAEQTVVTLVGACLGRAGNAFVHDPLEPMKPPTQDEISQRAQKLWQDYGRPEGRDTEIWLEAERQLSAGQPDLLTVRSGQEESQTSVEAKGAAQLAGRIQAATDTGATVEHHNPPPMPAKESSQETVQKKAARAPKRPSKSAPKQPPAETGKPLWDRPHSS